MVPWRARPAIETLERRFSPHTVMNDGTLARGSIYTRNINATCPGKMIGCVESAWPLVLQQSLGAPIPALLAPVRSNRWAAMVPDKRGGHKTDGPSFLLYPPTDIHV